MAGKIEERRDLLRQKLVDIAEVRIAEGGIGSVKARDLAQEAGCALGAIYNVFGDLTQIILAVNGRTFQRLGLAMQRDLQYLETNDAADRLVAIANAYLDFALTHTHLWRSLFDVEFSPDLEVPEWYWREMDHLFSDIAGPVDQAFSDLSDEDRALMTRALFSSVHGIVALGIENRAVPVPRQDMARMIALVIGRSIQKS